MNEPANASSPKILVLNGPMKGQYFQVSLPRCWIGRSASCEIVIDDPAMSGIHCTIELIGRRLFISDLSSTNGTKLNGRDVGEKPLRLKSGDNIFVGETLLSIVIPKSIAPQKSFDNISPSDQPSTTAPPVQHRYFPTFHRFATAPFCIQFSACFIGIHIILDILATTWQKEHVSFLALVTAWLLNDILKGKNYARITLLVIRLSTIPFALMNINDPQFTVYALSTLCVLCFSLFYLVPLFLPPANRWFRSHSTNC